MIKLALLETKSSIVPFTALALTWAWSTSQADTAKLVPMHQAACTQSAASGDSVTEVSANLADPVSAFLAIHSEVRDLIDDAQADVINHYASIGIPVRTALELFSDPDDGSQRVNLVLEGETSTSIRRALREFTRTWWTESNTQARQYFDFSVRLV